jgi:hypothetical protein
MTEPSPERGVFRWAYHHAVRDRAKFWVFLGLTAFRVVVATEVGLPEHARLEQLTPVIHLPARYQAALDKATSTSPRSGRCSSLRSRGHQRRGDGFELGDQLVELGGG